MIGASIRYGKHNKTVYKFIEDNQPILESKPSAFFSVNIVARKPLKNRVDTNPYVIKFFKQIAWRPKYSAVFGGKLDYQKYGMFDKYMIRFIMWMTKGPTDLNSVIEFTNWDDVDNFSKMFADVSSN